MIRKTLAIVVMISGCHLAPAPSPTAAAAPEPLASTIYDFKCKSGNAAACQRAYFFAERECVGRVAVSCGTLGHNYLLGVSGLRKDPPLAFKLLEKACALEDPVSCYELKEARERKARAAVAVNSDLSD